MRRWLLMAIVIVAAAVLAGVVVLLVGHHVITSSATTATVATNPPPSSAEAATTVRTGCGASSLMNDRISEAQQLNEPSLLDSVATGPGTPWAKVTAMELVGSDPTYRPLASSVRSFIQALTVARTTGDVGTAAVAMNSVIASCQTLGEPTSQ